MGEGGEGGEGLGLVGEGSSFGSKQNGGKRKGKKPLNEHCVSTKPRSFLRNKVERV